MYYSQSMFSPSENSLQYHTERSVSVEMVDLLSNSIVTEEYPSRVLLKIHGIHKFRYDIYSMKFKSELPFSLWLIFFLIRWISTCSKPFWQMRYCAKTHVEQSYIFKHVRTKLIYSTDKNLAIIIRKSFTHPIS